MGFGAGTGQTKTKAAPRRSSPSIGSKLTGQEENGRFLEMPVLLIRRALFEALFTPSSFSEAVF